MTRISKGLRGKGWAAFVVVLAGCAVTPKTETEAPPSQVEPVPEPAVSAPAALTPAPVPQEPLVLAPRPPMRYVVTKGDTLWEIAQRFLRDPWRWPELWQDNPQVANPHLLYPGDVLTLTYVDGQPALQVQRGETVETIVTPETPEVIGPTDRPYPTVKLSPQVRPEHLAAAIPTIPLDAIAPFLSRPRVVSENELQSAPYIFSSVDAHLVSGAGHRVYVRNLENPQTADFIVLRRGQPYVDPESGENLGYEAMHIGDARITRAGDPATFELVRTKREVLDGDRLLPAEDAFVEQNFVPHGPSKRVDGHIIAVLDGVSLIGQYNVVVLDRGKGSGVDVGSVMAIYQASLKVRDRIANETVRLPRERAGTLMVFRVFDRVSYALVMNATRPIHVEDAVTNP